MQNWRERQENERQAARKALARAAATAWAEWLRMRGPWQSMVTHTFADHVGIEMANGCYVRWTRLANKIAGRPIRWARATEYQRRGVLHFHSLIDGWLPYDAWLTSDELRARRRELEECWYRVGGGFSRIDPYTTPRALYCTKYVAEGGVIDLGGEWDSAASRQLRLPA